MNDLVCIRKGLPIDKMQGADNPALEAKIKEHYEAVGWDGEFQSGVKVAPQIHTGCFLDALASLRPILEIR